MKKEYIIPLSLILCVIILGNSYLKVQTEKLNSIEKQQQVEIEREKEIEKTQKLEKETNESLYDWCVNDAEEHYLTFMRLNAIEVRDNAILTEVSVREEANKIRQGKIDNCFIRYLK